MAMPASGIRWFDRSLATCEDSSKSGPGMLPLVDREANYRAKRRGQLSPERKRPTMATQNLNAGRSILRTRQDTVSNGVTPGLLMLPN